MAQDKKIRESYYKRDKDFNQKIKEEMQEEENMLKGYFKQYKKPTTEDPSVMKREASQDKIKIAKEVFSPFRVFRNFYEEYWNLQCATPEEQYVLNLCKEVVCWLQHKEADSNRSTNFTDPDVPPLMSSMAQVDRIRMIASAKIHALSFTVGLTSGILYGVIASSQYSLEKFESLGENYALGRATLNEISKFRMDKQK